MFELYQRLFTNLINQTEESLAIMSCAYIATIISLIIICFLTYVITKKIILKLIKRVIDKTTTKMDEIFYEKKVFHGLGHISPALVVYFFANSFNRYTSTVQNIAMVYILAIVCLSIFRALDAIVLIFREKSYQKAGPVKSIVQVIKIVIITFGILLGLVILIGNSVSAVLLGSFGGMSAVLLLIFKDSILGLVASIQLTVNDIMALGDWVEMPKYNANGEVTDITLSKIIIRNFDKTYTSIPAYRFLEDSFINWKGMQKSGGRRIKRSICIDMTTISFMTEEEIEELMKIDLIHECLMDYKSMNISEKKETNSSIFRQYVLEYLKRHPQINHDDFTLMVRQLPPSEKGLPIELYCFTNDTNWVKYESVQSDIIDHLLATMKFFGLRIYQYPTKANFVDEI
jgi:miniconductance mechanosensitive channel